MRLNVQLLVAAAVATSAGCKKDPEETGPDPTTVVDPGEGTGILGSGWANPYPSADLLDAEGRLALRDLPDTPSPIPIERLAWRTGFSPAQVAVLRLADVSSEGLPGWVAPTRGEGTVRMIDLTDGRDVLCFAELDAYPGADQQALLVRPLEALPVGHDIAVVVTTAAVDRPARYDALLSDAPPADLADVAPRYRALVEQLEAFGVPEADIAVAWQFPVGDGRAPLHSALSQLSVPGGHAIAEVRDRDAGGEVGPHIWRAAEGTFRAQQWLDEGNALQIAADGSVAPVGEVDADLYVYVPESVKDAPDGSVPVLVFGHGIFGDPSLYLDADDDPSRVAQLADEAGFVVIGTNWRGLTTSDRLIAVEVANDFAQFHQLTDLLVQGQTNTRTLIEYAASGDLFDDPVFEGVSGQLLVDPDRIYYYGISLGAIEGAVLLGNGAPLQAAAFHVGGGSWSTMLERSSNWSLFELFIEATIPSASERQVLYALSQLWWDPVDPMSYVDDLAGASFLLQESVGDEQVPNLTTEALARSMALPVLEPAVSRPVDVPVASGPLPAGSRALVQFDPQTERPPVDNRPAPVTEAHTTPRTWDGARLQVIEHLTDGRIVHHCGDAPCTAENTGGP
jgi:hypothetical protein